MTKAELGEILAAKNEQIDFLKAELSESRNREAKLNEQVIRLQDGLMAIRAPEAYRDMRSDARETTVPAEVIEAQKKYMQEQKFRERYVRAMEGDVIQTKEDLDELMNTVLMRGNNVGSKSLHGNTES